MQIPKRSITINNPKLTIKSPQLLMPPILISIRMSRIQHPSLVLRIYKVPHIMHHFLIQENSRKRYTFNISCLLCPLPWIMTCRISFRRRDVNSSRFLRSSKTLPSHQAQSDVTEIGRTDINITNARKDVQNRIMGLLSDTGAPKSVIGRKELNRMRHNLRMHRGQARQNPASALPTQRTSPLVKSRCILIPLL